MKTLLIEDVKKTLKFNPIKFILTWLLLWWLFFVFNIIFWVTISTDKIEQTAANKVWMYFYIQDDWINNDELTTRIINLTDELKKKWLTVQYTAKDKAFQYLENKIPELTSNFDKFGIENPLPSTLYVMFSNKHEYENMKSIIVANKDIIMNSKDVDKSATLLQQENRSLKILDIINTVKITLIVILWVVAVAIFTLTQHLLTNFFYSFYKDLELKKLLWADTWTANQWFLAVLCIILIWAIIFGTILSFIVVLILDMHLHALDINLWLKLTTLFAVIIDIIFAVLAAWLWYWHLNKLERKI